MAGRKFGKGSVKPPVVVIRCGPVVWISGFHPEDLGSIPSIGGFFFKEFFYFF